MAAFSIKDDKMVNHFSAQSLTMAGLGHYEKKNLKTQTGKQLCICTFLGNKIMAE